MSTACSKAAYDSKREVNVAITHVIGRAKRRDRGGKHAYRCCVCGKWHISIGVVIPPRRDGMRRALEMSGDES
jgi:hypothetical protein